MFRLFLASAVIQVMYVSASWAAPQIMGLVATAEPVPMQCGNGRCTALLSAFCLQEARLPPDLGTAYRPGGTDHVAVRMRMADGATVTANAAGLVEFSSQYGFTAVEASLPLERLGGEAPVSVTLEVKPRAALLPVTEPNDPDPQTVREIETATGPWRLAAEPVMEGSREAAIATREIMRLVNSLPTAGSEQVNLEGEIAPESSAMTQQVVRACDRSVRQSVGYSLRTCLEERHELLQIGNTREFWRSLTGS
jgi:hypothetical protein